MRILASTLVLVSAMGFSLLTLVRAAHAAVTCSYNGTDTVTVTLHAAGDGTTLAVESGSDDIQEEHSCAVGAPRPWRRLREACR